jgi:hypothetical protein
MGLEEIREWPTVAQTMLTVVTQIPGPFLGWARTATCTCLSKLGRRLISLAWQFQTVSVPIIENGHGSVRIRKSDSARGRKAHTRAMALAISPNEDYTDTVGPSLNAKPHVRAARCPN